MTRARRRRRVVRAPKSAEPTLDAKRAIINAIKQERGCFYCMEHTAICLEFHHVNPQNKKFAISEYRKQLWKDVLKEIEKCAVVCANCHRKLHYGHLPPIYF